MRSLAATSTACKAGAVLDLPGTTEAAAVPAAEARRTVTAQSRDFGAYRQRLAENAPTSNVAAASRKASGKLQANVEDRNAAASAPDKLTISQGSASTRAADEKVAQARQAQDSSSRVAELSKNINELNKLKRPVQAPARRHLPPPQHQPRRASPSDAIRRQRHDAAARRRHQQRPLLQRLPRLLRTRPRHPKRQRQPRQQPWRPPQPLPPQRLARRRPPPIRQQPRLQAAASEPPPQLRRQPLLRSPWSRPLRHRPHRNAASSKNCSTTR
jgi:hypothetical protein